MSVKTLEEFNIEFMAKEPKAERLPKQKEAQQEENLFATEDEYAEFVEEQIEKNNRSKLTTVAKILIYIAMLALIISTVVTSGFSFFTVISSSMQNELPKGSLLLVQQVEPEELEVGDNITFIRTWKTIITHKIVNTYENYRSSGVRGFQTRGTNNQSVDAEIVSEDNVIGKVIFSIPILGAVLDFISENIYVALIVFATAVTLIFIIHKIRSKKRLSYDEI